jgi:hypothetical protein
MNRLKLKTTLAAFFLAALAALGVRAQEPAPPEMQDAINGLAQSQSFGAPLSGFTRAVAVRARETGTSAYWQNFQHGTIYAGSVDSKRGSAVRTVTVRGTIRARYAELQYHNSRLGFPSSEEIQCRRPDTRDRYQKFERGIIYWQASRDYARVFYGSPNIWPDNNCDPATAERQPARTADSSADAASRFRVTLLGFQADEQTDDDALQRDGKGDEVYLFTHVARYNGSGVRPTSVDRYSTILMGDVNLQSNPERMLVGDLSDQGGIGTGFRFLPRNPTRGAYSGLTLPLVVYEGELRAGADAVLIVPTIWEWDGNPLFREFYNRRIGDSFFNSAVTGSFVREAITSGATTAYGPGPVYDTEQLNWKVETQGLGDGDRAVGDGIFDGRRSFTPKFLLLTNAQATALADRVGSLPQLRSGDDATSTVAEPLYPRDFLKGIVSVRYVSPPNQPKGSYTLFLKVEKLN